MNKIQKLFILLVLTGCIPVLHERTTPVEPSKDASFYGINAKLKEPGNKRVVLLIVHGMGNQTLDYADQTIADLAGELSLMESGATQCFPIRQSGSQVPYYGIVRLTQYLYGKHPVDIYTLLWAPTLFKLEQDRLGYDEKAVPGRAWLNRKLKIGLIDGSVSDAFAFTGSSHTEMEYAMRAGLCAVAFGETQFTQECSWDRKVQDADLFIVTHSLGSSLLLTTLAEMSADPEQSKAADALIGETSLVALLANQFPLFRYVRELPRNSPPDPLRDRRGDLRTLERVLSGFPSQTQDGQPVAFVAFSDPNDLLSFAVPDNWQNSLFRNPALKDHIRFVNVSVNNGWPYLGILANPAKAHEHYWKRRKVVKFLAHGYGHDDEDPWNHNPSAKRPPSCPCSSDRATKWEPCDSPRSRR